MKNEGQKINRSQELLNLIRDNPELPVIPMVAGEVVADDSYPYWMGSWGSSEVTEYYVGREKVHFKSDDIEDVLMDMNGCRYGYTKDGRDIYDDLTDEEWDEIYNSLPWKKAIVVYIGTPDE